MGMRQTINYLEKLPVEEYLKGIFFKQISGQYLVAIKQHIYPEIINPRAAHIVVVLFSFYFTTCIHIYYIYTFFFLLFN